MTPKEINGLWWVDSVDERGAQRSVGPFKSHTEAWRWIDRNEGEPISRSESLGIFIRESNGGVA